MQSSNVYAAAAGQGEDMHDPRIVICLGGNGTLHMVRTMSAAADQPRRRQFSNGDRRMCGAFWLTHIMLAVKHWIFAMQSGSLRKKTCLAHGEGHVSSGGPSTAQADLKQRATDAWRVLADIHHVRSQRETLSTRSRHICLQVLSFRTALSDHVKQKALL